MQFEILKAKIHRATVIRGEEEPRIGPLPESAKEYFERTHVCVQYEKGDMLVFDNWRMLHARNALTDLGRHLRRIQIAAEPSA